MVKFERKSVRQQFGYHEFHLVQAGLAFDIRFSSNIEQIGTKPGRRAHDLLAVQSISKGNEIVHVGVERHELIGSVAKALALRSRFARLDGCHFESRIGIRCHWLWWLRNCPGRIGVGPLQR